MFGAIGDIIYTLYNGFFEQIIPMMQTFIVYLFTPLNLILDPISQITGLGFVGLMLDLVIALFGNYSLFEIMIGGGFSFYIIFTLFRYFWGTVEFF